MSAVKKVNCSSLCVFFHGLPVQTHLRRKIWVNGEKGRQEFTVTDTPGRLYWAVFQLMVVAKPLTSAVAGDEVNNTRFQEAGFKDQLSSGVPTISFSL